MKNSTVPISLRKASVGQLLAAVIGLILLPFIIGINKLNGPVILSKAAK